MSKGTGLSNFAKRQPPATSVESEATGSSTERQRGKRNTVAITVRLTRAQWQRLHELALHEGASLQGLAVRGFSALLKEKGLPSL